MKQLKFKLSLIFLALSVLFTSACSDDQEFQRSDFDYSSYSSTVNQKAQEKKVDLLVVVDNSVSMLKDQVKLSKEFSNFISAISQSDYRLGVITTDTNSVGKENEPGYFGNLDILNLATKKRFLEKGDQNKETLFAEAITREEGVNCSGNCPSGYERPLTAIRMALEKRHSVNAGFFREGADLAVVIISDEDETGVDKTDPTSEYYSAADLIDYFDLEFSGNKKLLSFNISILEGDQACYNQQLNELKDKDPNDVSYGNRISELYKLTDGFPLSICDKNYGEGLSEISRYIQKKLLPFKMELPESLVVTSLKIKIMTPEGKGFKFEHKIKNGHLEIHPLPPEGSKIDLQFKY